VDSRSPAFWLKRGLAQAWGLFPSETIKTTLVWAMGPRFLVSVVAVVFDDRGRVLLLRHTHDRAHPWGLPSGRLERRETPVQAVIRELREETGLQGEVRALVALERVQPLPVLRAAYLCRVRGEFRPSVEVAEAAYFTPAALPAGVRAVQRKMISQARQMEEHRCES